MSEHKTNTLTVSSATLTVVVAIVAFEILTRNVFGVAGGYLGGFLVMGAAVFAVRLILRTAPSMFSVSPTAEQWLQGARPAAAARIRHYAEWFILMRWIAVIVTLTLIVFIVRIARLLDSETYGPLIVTVVVLAALNLLYTYLNHLGRCHDYLLQLQVGGDLLVLAVLLHLSGGVENPLALVMVLHVIIAGILLSRVECYAVAAFGSVVFGAMALLELSGHLEHYALLVFPHEHGEDGLLHAAHEPLYVFVLLGLHTTILLLIALFVTTLSTRQRRDEQQLIAIANEAITEGHLLQQSLETTGTAMRVVDERLNTCFANRRWSQWFEEPAARQSLAEQLNSDRSHMRQTLKDGRARSVLLEESYGSAHDVQPQADRDSARGHVYRMTTAVLPVSSGSARQVVQIAQDVTELKEAEARLIRAGQLAAVGELASHVAHEVNNPIAIISAKARLMLTDEETELAPGTADELRKIVDLSDRVARIAQGLLAYSRPLTPSRTMIDITQPIRHALSAIAERVAGAGIAMSHHVNGPVPRIHGNSQELGQVFLNVLLNALDAMPDGGQLTISVSRQDERIGQVAGPFIAIVVQDTGAGIPPEVRERIFQPFFTTKEKGSGTGLGLSICEDLVRSHGGDITVSSEVGQGTTVTIWLPVGSHCSAEESPDGAEADSGR